MSHFTPNYMPWDERLCAVPDGDLFKALRSGDASVVTDHIETFTEKGILLKSGQELEADIIVTATGLEVQMLGGIELSVDGEARELRDQMTYKAVLVEDLPNLAWIFGYTNAPWTLKSDIAASTSAGCSSTWTTTATPSPPPATARTRRWTWACSTRCSPATSSGPRTPCRARARTDPWKVLMHYGQDSKMLLEDPVDDGLVEFAGSRQPRRGGLTCARSPS